MTAPADGFLPRLAARAGYVRSVLCLGLDPDPAALPPGFPPDLRGVERFARLILEAALPFAAAVKPNLAFYEAFGSGGIAVLERLRAAIPADVPVVIDAKRGDIGSTAARQAAAVFDGLGADAVTASPYLGRDALEAFLERGFVHVLCRTSNPSAGELQDLPVGPPVPSGPGATVPGPLHLHVARLVASWPEAPERLGLVVGATAAAELESVRTAAPNLAFLVPGVGMQGGDVAAVLASAPAREGIAASRAGRGMLVNVSRGIAGAALATPPVTGGDDPGARIAAAAERWAALLPVVA